MNFSKTICLPKQALKNLDLEEGDSLKVELVEDEDEKLDTKALVSSSQLLAKELKKQKKKKGDK